MPEQHTEVCTLVIRRHNESAVHIGVTPWFLAQHLAYLIELEGLLRGNSALGHCCPGERGCDVFDDAEGLPRGVKVHRVQGFCNMPHIMMVSDRCEPGESVKTTPK